MRCTQAFAAVLLVAGTGIAAGQNMPTEQSIQAQLQGPFLMLRGMYDGERLAFDARGQLIGSAPPLPFSLSFLIVRRVNLTQDEVEIDASRAGLLITRGWPEGAPDKVKAVPIDKKAAFRWLSQLSGTPNIAICWTPL